MDQRAMDKTIRFSKHYGMSPQRFQLWLEEQMPEKLSPCCNAEVLLSCNYCGGPVHTDPDYCYSCKEYKIVPEWTCTECGQSVDDVNESPRQ